MILRVFLGLGEEVMISSQGWLAWSGHRGSFLTLQLVGDVAVPEWEPTTESERHNDGSGSSSP